MSFQVHFQRSGVSVAWDPVLHAQLSILELAEQAGLNLRAGCRSGYCGACKTAVQGEVRYFYNAPKLAAGQALICSCVPASDLTVMA
ncbi:MAG: hypothetical protein RL095_522 [Verrucomicrobiota bacterium]|jgi:ferredoxin